MIDTRQAGSGADRPRAAVAELDATGRGFPAGKPTLVHQAVMFAAEQHEIVERRITSLSPMHDRVAVNQARVRTARKTTATVTQAKRATNSGRDAAGLAANGQRFAKGIV